MVNRLMSNRSRIVTGAALALGLAAVAHATPALAAEAQAEMSVDVSAPSVPSEPSASSGNEAAFLLAGKVGGIVPFNGLDPFVSGGIELGWIFAGTDQRICALLDVTYTAPEASGGAADPRLASGAFDWEISQKELILQPTFLYRLTGLGPIVPFAGIGPRIYLLETVSQGSSGGVTFQESKERSTKLGAGLPLGAEYELGPGGLMAELLTEWAPLDHRVTGDVSLLGMTLFLGYRARL
jgi:hypothetical protein